MATREEDKVTWLTQRVFGTQEGQDLLREWQLQFCSGLGSDNALTMARRVGRADFINEVIDLATPER